MPKVKTKTSKVPVLDIYLAAFLSLKGIQPQLTNQDTRVTFEFTATDDFYKLAKEYNSNASVPVLDFASEVRKLKAQMYSQKTVKGR